MFLIFHDFQFSCHIPLEQLAHTLVLFHAGKLKENLAVVVLEHLDVGRYHAVCVDTVAQHVGGGVVDAVFHLGLKGLGHGVIALARLDDRVEDNRDKN